MKPYYIRHFTRIVAALLLSLSYVDRVLAQDEERLVFNPQTGWYSLYYYHYVGPRVLQRVDFELPNKTDPTIKSKVKETDTGLIRYEYKIKNGHTSQQNLRGIRLLVSHAFEANQSTPRGWDGSVVPNILTPEVIVGWSYWSSEIGSGLKPSQSQKGFAYISRDLPGVSLIEAWGAAKPSPKEYSFTDEGPDPETAIGKQYRELIEREEYVRRLAAVPKIPVPTPFDAAMVLGGIQKHIKDDLIGMKLIDPVLASQLDRSLQAAIDAAKINNTAAVRSNIKEARKLLKKEHEDVDSEDDQDFDKDDANETKKSALIDRLAARVLDFDLKYVEKWLKVE